MASGTKVIACKQKHGEVNHLPRYQCKGSKIKRKCKMLHDWNASGTTYPALLFNRVSCISSLSLARGTRQVLNACGWNAIPLLFPCYIAFQNSLWKNSKSLKSLRRDCLPGPMLLRVSRLIPNDFLHTTTSHCISEFPAPSRLQIILSVCIP